MNNTSVAMPLEHPKITRIEYFMMFLLIATSGSPLIVYSTGYFKIITVLLAFIITINFKRKTLDKTIVRWLIIFGILFIAQYLVLTAVSIPADINYLAGIYYAFLAASFMGVKFRYAYMRVMVFVAVISLVLWPVTLFYSYPGVSIDRYTSVLFHNYIPYISNFERRNCGMFWEPGAYQGYIMIVPLLYISDLRQFIRQFKRESIILLIALLSTMSTTGYVVFATFVFFMSIKYIRNTAVKVVSIAIFMAGVSFAYTTFDFLGEKIKSQYEEAQNIRDGQVLWSRAGSMMIDIDNIIRHPVIGNGFLMEVRYGEIGDDMSGAGNGFTGAINALGIPLFLLYLLGLYKNNRYKSKYDGFVFCVIISLLLVGEAFLNYALFWSLLFIKYPKRDFIC